MIARLAIALAGMLAFIEPARAHGIECARAIHHSEKDERTGNADVELRKARGLALISYDGPDRDSVEPAPRALYAIVVDSIVCVEEQTTKTIYIAFRDVRHSWKAADQACQLGRIEVFVLDPHLAFRGGS
jgi:hypothetical protein